MFKNGDLKFKVPGSSELQDTMYDTYLSYLAIFLHIVLMKNNHFKLNTSLDFTLT